MEEGTEVAELPWVAVAKRSGTTAIRPPQRLDGGGALRFPPHSTTPRSTLEFA